MPAVSIVVPAFNEQENIPLFIDAISKSLHGIESDYEIIFVNDGSTDDSLKLLRGLATEDKRVKYISFSRNFGQQAAITAGIDHAGGDAIITMDADLQDPPQLIPEMLNAWKAGNDVVLMRRTRRHEGFFKRNTARMYYKLLNNFSDHKFPGNVGDFRLIDKKVAEVLKGLKEKSRYLRGMICWMGFPHTVIDYDRPNRTKGKTGFSLLKMVRLGMSGILNFSLLPLRLGLVAGVAIIIVGFLFLFYIIGDILINDVYYEIHKWLGVTTFIFTGFLFVLVWILGEYIGKIYDEVKNRPLYLISEKGNVGS